MYPYMSQDSDRWQVQLASEHADKNETKIQPEGPQLNKATDVAKLGTTGALWK